jgi:alkylated DNA repair dioxygenase AlkB
MNNNNILPREGEVLYQSNLWTIDEASSLSAALINEISWEHDEVMMFGKKIVTRRKVAWYGDYNFAYTYSKVVKVAEIWTSRLREIKERVEAESNEKFNSCLLNLYHDGTEAMSWHTDNEKTLRKEGTIASVSFGVERRFDFKHKTTSEVVSLILEHGSLLLMKGKTQQNWLHRLPPTKKTLGARVNLTFRQFEL